MTAATAPASATPSAVSSGGLFHGRLLAAAALALLGDRLFFDQPVGVSLAVFLAAVALAAALVAGRRAGRARVGAALGLCALALAPLVEDFSALSVGLGVLGVTAACAWLHERRARTPLARLWGAMVRPLSGPIRLLQDLSRARRAGLRLGRALAPVAWALRWVAPAALTLAFLALFYAANPVIEDWVAGLDPTDLVDALPNARVMLFLTLFAAVWPCLRPNRPWRRHQARRPAPARAPAGAGVDHAQVWRALALFNLAFGLQTGLDAAYLWGGARLPQGLTYAEYAHRGAYPLAAAAALAAGLALWALRAGSPAERAPQERLLAFAWLGQSLALVVSALMRLDLYVQVYALSTWRAAAAIWMLLIGAGLALILARLALRRSDAWLVNANLLVAGLTLYACCFVGFPDLIARYNIAHSREIAGRGVALDIDYLCELGPETLPALDAFVAELSARGRRPPARLGHCPEALAASVRRRTAEWRTWSFRGARLLRYVEARESAGGPAAGEAERR